MGKNGKKLLGKRPYPEIVRTPPTNALQVWFNNHLEFQRAVLKAIIVDEYALIRPEEFINPIKRIFDHVKAHYN